MVSSSEVERGGVLMVLTPTGCLFLRRGGGTMGVLSRVWGECVCVCMCGRGVVVAAVRASIFNDTQSGCDL